MRSISTDKSQYQNFSPPFEIPESWQWVRLEDIAYVASGSTPSKESFVPHGIPYLKMYNLRKQKIDFQYQPQYISEEVHNGKLSRSRATAGDIIMNIVGPPLGKLAIIPTTLKECNFNQAAVMIRPFYLKDILSEYLFNYLEEMSEINCISTKGTAGQVNISLTQAQNMRISLPPEREMICINEKVRQYRSILEILDNSSNELTDSIAKAKSKILDLAMQGKLVPQDPADEPAADMLRRINPKAKIITDNPHSWNIPNGWCWIKVSDVFTPLKRQLPTGEKFWYIDIDSVDNKQNIAYPKNIPIANAPSRASRYTQKGDVLFSMVRPYLRNIALVPQKDCIASTGFYVLHPSGAIDSMFSYLLALSTFFVDGLNSYMKGDNSPSIKKDNIENFVIPLPPLAEQTRIAAKVKELYSMFDEIEASLQS